MTRLKRLCEVFGWQGGTIHQANDKAAAVLNMTHFDALELSENDFNDYLEYIEMRIIPSDWFKD